MQASSVEPSGPLAEYPKHNSGADTGHSAVAVGLKSSSDRAWSILSSSNPTSVRHGAETKLIGSDSNVHMDENPVPSPHTVAASLSQYDSRIQSNLVGVAAHDANASQRIAAFIPLPDQSIFNNPGPAFGRSTVLGMNRSPNANEYRWSKAAPACPPTPARTPAWAHSERKGRGPLQRQDSLTENKLLMLIPNEGPWIDNSGSTSSSAGGRRRGSVVTAGAGVAGQGPVQTQAGFARRSSSSVFPGASPDWPSKGPSLSLDDLTSPGPNLHERKGGKGMQEMAGEPVQERAGVAAQQPSTAGWGAASILLNNANPSLEADFHVVRTLGVGSFSKVLEVTSKVQPTFHFALKKTLKRMRSKRDRYLALREIRAAARVGPHPNLIRYYSAWQEEGHLLFVTELCSGGNLRDAVGRLPPHVPVPEQTAWTVIAHVAHALLHMHSKGWVHLDVKPDNVLLDRTAWLKLGDLGIAGEYTSFSASTAALSDESHDQSGAEGGDSGEHDPVPGPSSSVFVAGRRMSGQATVLPRGAGTSRRSSVQSTATGTGAGSRGGAALESAPLDGSRTSDAADDEGDSRYMAPELLGTDVLLATEQGFTAFAGVQSPAGMLASAPLSSSSSAVLTSTGTTGMTARAPPADIFSLGMTVFELVWDIPAPVEGIPWQDIRQGRVPPCNPAFGRPELLLYVVRAMLRPNPLERPTAEQLLALPQCQAALVQPDPFLVAHVLSLERAKYAAARRSSLSHVRASVKSQDGVSRADGCFELGGQGTAGRPGYNLAACFAPSDLSRLAKGSVPYATTGGQVVIELAHVGGGAGTHGAHEPKAQSVDDGRAMHAIAMQGPGAAVGIQGPRLNGYTLGRSESARESDAIGFMTAAATSAAVPDSARVVASPDDSMSPGPNPSPPGSSDPQEAVWAVDSPDFDAGQGDKVGVTRAAHATQTRLRGGSAASVELDSVIGSGAVHGVLFRGDSWQGARASSQATPPLGPADTNRALLIAAAEAAAFRIPAAQQGAHAVANGVRQERAGTSSTGLFSLEDDEELREPIPLVEGLEEGEQDGRIMPIYAPASTRVAMPSASRPRPGQVGGSARPRIARAIAFDSDSDEDEDEEEERTGSREVSGRTMEESSLAEEGDDEAEGAQNHAMREEFQNGGRAAAGMGSSQGKAVFGHMPTASASGTSSALFLAPTLGASAAATGATSQVNNGSSTSEPLAPSLSQSSASLSSSYPASTLAASASSMPVGLASARKHRRNYDKVPTDGYGRSLLAGASTGAHQPGQPGDAVPEGSAGLNGSGIGFSMCSLQGNLPMTSPTKVARARRKGMGSSTALSSSQGTGAAAAPRGSAGTGVPMAMAPQSSAGFMLPLSQGSLSLSQDSGGSPGHGVTGYEGHERSTSMAPLAPIRQAPVPMSLMGPPPAPSAPSRAAPPPMASSSIGVSGAPGSLFSPVKQVPALFGAAHAGVVFGATGMHAGTHLPPASPDSETVTPNAKRAHMGPSPYSATMDTGSSRGAAPAAGSGPRHNALGGREMEVGFRANAVGTRHPGRASPDEEVPTREGLAAALFADGTDYGRQTPSTGVGIDAGHGGAGRPPSGGVVQRPPVHHYAQVSILHTPAASGNASSQIGARAVGGTQPQAGSLWACSEGIAIRHAQQQAGGAALLHEAGPIPGCYGPDAMDTSKGPPVRHHAHVPATTLRPALHLGVHGGQEDAPVPMSIVSTTVTQARYQTGGGGMEEDQSMEMTLARPAQGMDEGVHFLAGQRLRYSLGGASGVDTARSRAMSDGSVPGELCGSGAGGAGMRVPESPQLAGFQNTAPAFVGSTPVSKPVGLPPQAGGRGAHAPGRTARDGYSYPGLPLQGGQAHGASPMPSQGAASLATPAPVAAVRQAPQKVRPMGSRLQEACSDAEDGSAVSAQDGQGAGGATAVSRALDIARDALVPSSSSAFTGYNAHGPSTGVPAWLGSIPEGQAVLFAGMGSMAGTLGAAGQGGRLFISRPPAGSDASAGSLSRMDSLSSAPASSPEGVGGFVTPAAQMVQLNSMHWVSGV